MKSTYCVRIVACGDENLRLVGLGKVVLELVVLDIPGNLFVLLFFWSLWSGDSRLVLFTHRLNRFGHQFWRGIVAEGLGHLFPLIAALLLFLRKKNTDVMILKFTSTRPLSCVLPFSSLA